MTSQRNDGNKVYEILAVSPTFMGVPLPLNMTASSVLSNGSDVYVTVRITIDSSKYVKPLATTTATVSTKPLTTSVIGAETEQLLKYRTITKYSYFESGEKWVKVLLPDLAGLKDHDPDMVKIEFPTPRSFSVVVLHWRDQNWQFTVPRTQCRILPQACTFVHKSSGLQINLRKKNTSDNWWTLFKSKAVGERPSDDEDEKEEAK